MIYLRAPPKKRARKGFYFPLDKQLPLAVLSDHDERCKDGHYNDLPDMQRQLPPRRKTSQRSSPVSLPEVHGSRNRVQSVDDCGVDRSLIGLRKAEALVLRFFVYLCPR